jgi:uroporphyrinogen decarboxylase
VGGVDKLPLNESPKAIEKELLRIAPLVEQGGFIPTVDHRVPASVPFENYKFYLKTKRQLFKAGCREPQYKE